jgi:lipopolysaccharide/colanic/teichoic acid biosynthesis glycosyltransferase
MIILGRKYKFTSLELDRLGRNFSNIAIIRYTNRDPDDVISELKEHVKSNAISLLVLNTKAKVDDELIKYLTSLQFNGRGNPFRLISIEHFLEEYLHKCYIPEANNDLHFLEDIKPFTKWQYIQKRAIDYFGVFWLFFFSWPVLIYSRYTIKKQSPGTSMFKQLRIGLNNREFKCVKFRSMSLDAEAQGAQFASENDSRVFTYGETMRKTRIDEVPQMLNILKGEMHLIGPRPERKVWTDQFESIIPYYAERHLVRPGVTGWAQVMYPYGANNEDARQKLMYDLYYIKHWSMALELKIVWMTAMTVIGKKGI